MGGWGYIWKHVYDKKSKKVVGYLFSSLPIGSPVCLLCWRTLSPSMKKPSVRENLVVDCGIVREHSSIPLVEYLYRY